MLSEEQKGFRYDEWGKKDQFPIKIRLEKVRCLRLICIWHGTLLPGIWEYENECSSIREWLGLSN